MASNEMKQCNQEPSNNGLKPFEASPVLCAELERIGTRQAFTAGSILFRQGEQSRGVFLVISGRVALSSGEDPTRITRIADTHSILGLPATVRNKPYSLTAEAVADGIVCHVLPARFRELLAGKPSVGAEVVTILAEELIALRRLAVYRM